MNETDKYSASYPPVMTPEQRRRLDEIGIELCLHAPHIKQSDVCTGLFVNARPSPDKPVFRVQYRGLAEALEIANDACKDLSILGISCVVDALDNITIQFTLPWDWRAK